MTADLHRMIDRDRLIERTVELIRLPSVNPFDGPGDRLTGEHRVAHWMAEHLDRLGYDPDLSEPAPGRPNVVGLGPGGDGPILCLADHTDTVGVNGYGAELAGIEGERPDRDSPAFRGEVRDGRIHGRGACDMKGALAAFVEVAEALSCSDRRLAGRLKIAGLADEEHAMIGSQALGATGPVADQVIVGEPTGLRICTAHKGQYAFSIETYGVAVHSSIAGQGVNAIDHMTEIIVALGHYGRELTGRDSHAMCGTGSVNSGVIVGGEIASIVPDYCRLEVDRRLVPGESADQVAAEIGRLIDRVAAGRDDFRWAMGPPSIDAAPLDTAADQPVVGAARRAMANRSLPDQPVAFSGATDAPNLAAPAIIWGPGSLDQAHTTDEWLSIDELEAAAHLYLDAAVDLLA
ncbi:MAG: M20 family metallopeptidase [Acidimicrobiales bacterium]